MRIIIGATRLVLAVLMLCAIVATYAYVAERAGTTPNPFNFFGYFTIQSNLIGIVAIAGSALMLLRGRPSPRWFAAFRGAAVAYLAIVGVVYAVLLAPLGLEGGVPVPWANAVLHLVSPIAAAADWILVADRPALPWRRLWVVLVYPAVWLGVVLVRGATDGWVPYPFLSPENGAAAITAVCIGIALAILAAGALATLFSRVRLPFADTMVERQGAPSPAD